MLPLSKAVESAWKSIRLRLSRSLLVTSGIVLALAFLMSILTSEAMIKGMRAWIANPQISVTREQQQALRDELTTKTSNLRDAVAEAAKARRTPDPKWDAEKVFGKPLAELAAPVELYPQLLINIPLRPGLEWQDSSPLGQALKEVKALVEPEGRIVVRPSGTEPLLRVMIETPHQELLDQASQRIQTADDFPGLTCTLLSPAG